MKTNFLKNVLTFGLISCMVLTFTVCSDDDNSTEDPNEEDPVVVDPTDPDVVKDAFFIQATGDEYSYIMLLDNVNSGEVSISENYTQLMQSYTWIFNSDPAAAVGLYYSQGDPAPCLGYTVSSSGISKIGETAIDGGFGTYGYVGQYALAVRSGQTPAGDDGEALVHESGEFAGETRRDAVILNVLDVNSGLANSTGVYLTMDELVEGQQATFAGIVDLGNNTFLTGLVVSDPPTGSTSNGNTTGDVRYPAGVWVAQFKLNVSSLSSSLELERIYESDKLSYAAGRMRSQYYSQIGLADDGYTYVFSGSFLGFSDESVPNAGALRIAKGATNFDSDYYYDIETALGGYKFRKVWHITESYFLLEVYNEVTPATPATAAASQYVVVNAAQRSLEWVNGLPDKDEVISTGLPYSSGGVIYFPMTAGSDDATIYIIDPETATATKGVTIIGAESISAIGKF